MGVYSVLLPDSEILERLSGFRSVTILGCTACANSSIAYDKDLPLTRLVVDETTQKTRGEPVAIVVEAQRLKALLAKEGIDTSIEMLPGPCVLSAERELADAELVERCARTDAVLTLCCTGGTVGVDRRLTDRAQTISGMKTVGSTLSYTVVDKGKGLVYMDQERSRMIRAGRP